MEKTAKKHEIDMLNGPLFFKILVFTLPIIASSFLQLFFNAADLIIVGNFDTNKELAVGAVGATSSLTGLLMAVFMGLSIGTSTTVAMAVGAKRDEDASRLVHTSMLTALYAGLFLAVAGWFLSPLLLEVMNTDALILPMATLYMRIYFLGAPATLLYNFGFGIMRTLGDTRRPLIYMCIAGVCNIGLNLFLVIVCKLGVAGVAIATVVSLAISAFLVIRAMMKYENACRFELRRLHFSRRHFLKIMRIGIPAGIQSMMFGLSNTILQASVNSFGAAATAGCAAASSLESFCYVAMNSFSHASSAFTGQNHGAGQYKRIKRVLLCCLVLVTLIGMLMSGVMLLFRTQFIGIYLPDAPDAVPYAYERMMSVLALYFLCGVMEVLLGCLRGIDISLVPMIATVIGVCGLRLLWIFFVFPIPALHSVSALYGCYPISWAITALFHAGCLCYHFSRLNKTKDALPAEG